MKKDNYYVVLHGARKNVGDFLIRDRSLKLIHDIRKDRKLIEYPNWESLDEHIDVINKANALILMGGPGIQDNIYPNVYPLTSNLDDIKVPIILLGLGSYLFPFNDIYINTFQFSKKAVTFIKKCQYISVRDSFTKYLLNKKGIRNVIVSGCPAWYNIDYLNSPVIKPISINKIALSFPQKKYHYNQFINLVDIIKNKFPSAHITVVFNRGFKKDKYTSEGIANQLYRCKQIIEGMNIEVINSAYDVDKFSILESYDLHIGFRLHTHIFFCSIRKPSYVIAEDSRSWGNFQTLSLPGFVSFNDSLFSNWIPYMKGNLFKSVIYKLLPIVKLDKFLGEKILNRLDYDISNNFTAFEELNKKIDSNYLIMKKYIESFP